MEMNLHDAPVRVVERVRGAIGARPLGAAQAAALARFPRRRRKAVMRLALQHPYLADLLVSFPAAIFAMAHGPRRRTRAAQTLAMEGAALKAVADALGLPMWARRVPVEACCEELLLPLPRGHDFAPHVGNVMPRAVRDWPAWLMAVSVAYRTCDEAFALWVAREVCRYCAPAGVDGIAVLGVWAWHSRSDGAAVRYMPTRWHRGMAIRSAAEATADWLRGLRFELSVAPAPIRVVPPVDTAVGAYTFHPVGWGAPLVAEGARMKNCLATYAWEYVRGSRVWSVHRDGVPVAALELAFGGTRRGIPRLEQLQGIANAEAPDDVWAAAYAWLARWSLSEEEIAVAVGDDVVRRDGAWTQLWRPYWTAKGLPAGGGVPLPVTSGYEPDVDDMIQAVQPLAYLNQRRR